MKFQLCILFNFRTLCIIYNNIVQIVILKVSYNYFELKFENIIYLVKILHIN